MQIAFPPNGDGTGRQMLPTYESCARSAASEFNIPGYLGQ